MKTHTDKAIFTCSIDGPDGAGKTTLINSIIEHYQQIVIQLPKSSNIGLLPLDETSRKNWFGSEDAFVSTRIYLESHRCRLRLLSSLLTRSHYQMTTRSRHQGPFLVLIDRGPHSTMAYSFAALSSVLHYSHNLMWDWVFTQGKQLLDTPIDLEILLLPKTTASNNSSSRDISGLLATRKGLPYADMARETDLIDLQIHAFQAIEERMTWPILQFDPFLNPDDIRSEVIQNIDHNLERNELRMTKPRHCGRTYLSEAISRLSRAEISNTIWLCRGIVEKGYSDNDVDVMCKDLGDFPLLLKAGGPIELHLLPYSPEEETWKMRLLPPK